MELLLLVPLLQLLYMSYLVMHCVLSQLHIYSKHKVRDYLQWCWESMTFQFWTVWPYKSRLLVGVSSQGSKATSGTATIYTLSHFLQTPPHDSLPSSPMAQFLPLEIVCCSKHTQCPFVLSGASINFSLYQISKKSRDVGVEKVWFVTPCKTYFRVFSSWIKFSNRYELV